MSIPDSASKAAELAAQQVEAIIEAAEAAAKDMEAEAERKLAEERERLEAEYEERRKNLEGEVAELREVARAEADKERTEAHEQAMREREEALAEAKRVRDAARAEAAERVAAAEKAADDALADARAISGGLRRLGQSLEEYAERILREVQGSHRRLRGDLRIASGGPASPGESVRRAPAAADEEQPARPAGGERPARSRRARSGEDIDVPSWVAKDE